MKCYNHHDTDALGICKNCNKGLCKDCLTEIENGIACTSNCVDEVTQINSLINRNKKSHNTAHQTYMRNAFIYGGMGILLIIFGLQDAGLIKFFIPLGALFLIGAGLSINSAQKFKNG